MVFVAVPVCKLLAASFATEMLGVHPLALQCDVPADNGFLTPRTKMNLWI